MKCWMCRQEFDAEEAAKACKGCALFGGCKKVKCPHCGYEMPAESRLLRWLKDKAGRGSHEKNNQEKTKHHD